MMCCIGYLPVLYSIYPEIGIFWSSDAEFLSIQRCTAPSFAAKIEPNAQRMLSTFNMDVYRSIWSISVDYLVRVGVHARGTML